MWLRKSLDKCPVSNYNVITMITKIITIGNSQGIRIPKTLLEESRLDDEVELKVKKGEIKIVSAPKKKKLSSDTMLLSEKSLATDWDREEEDKAWASLK